MHQEPDVGFDPRSPGWRPGPKAGAKPLHHPGIPSCANLIQIPFLFLFFIFIFLKISLFTRDTEGETETQAEGEAGSMHREPHVGFDPGSPGSRPGPKAGAKPLHHPGIPSIVFKLQRYTE